ncbi:hypothetical protein, partial [Mesorhizobium sp. M2E.F.Ca.ET.154.01.1.1]|uniref:hypothetical protein n=1 Tax=Mesorhizobium sp. M2E.F.Ca.ET.154.01.1.1 TaxID=2500521 RepID=UPI001AEDE8A1
MRLSTPLAAYPFGLGPFEAVEQVRKPLRHLFFQTKCGERAQKALRRFCANLAPDIVGESSAPFAIVAVHGPKSCVGFETPAARQWFPHWPIEASKAVRY